MALKISELAQASGVPVATIKFYLREGLLAPGRPLSRTQADYGDAHLQRLQLVRALAGPGGLDLAGVRRVLAAIDAPAPDRVDILAVAQAALVGPPSAAPDEAAGDASAGAAEDSRARRWVQARGWAVDADDPLLERLDAAWQACDAGELGLDEERLDRYADAMEQVARIDVATVPEEPAAAVRQAVLGTVLVDPVLAALRKLAQQHVVVSGAFAEDPPDGRPAS